MASSPIAIALALALALLVDTRIRGRGVYRAIIFVSYPLMSVAVGIIWRWLYDEKVGLINYVLLSLHLTQRRIAFLDSYEWAMPSVVVAAVWQIVGFFMVILLAGLQNIPPNLEEAAALDGASAGQRFRHITLPLLRPAIFLCPPALLPRAVHPFYYVDVWYYIPFVRYLINSVIVSVIVVAANLVCNALAAYALTLRFRGKRAIVALLLSCMLIPFQATIIPAYLITKELHLLNSHLGLALPLCSTIVCIFVFKASFDAVPRSLIDAARIDGLAEWRIIRHVMLPLSTSAVATTVILSFIWSWNSFLWPLIVVRNEAVQTLPLGLSTFLSYMENTTGALYAFCIMVLVPGVALFLLEQRRFIDGLTSGATKG